MASGASNFTIANASVVVSANTSGLQSQVQRDVGGLGSRLGAMGAAAGAAMAAALVGATVAGLAGIGKSIGLAADLEQSMGGVDAVFKDNATTIHGWANNAYKDVGLTKDAYNVFATQIGAQLKGAGVPMDELGGKTNDLITKGADLASMFGGTTSDAVSALGAGMRGEYDSLEKYGIAIKQSDVNAELAARGQDKLTGEALRNANATAYLDLITQQTADATGNFARETQTLSGGMQIARSGLENVAAGFGQVLLPAVAAVVGRFNSDLLPIIQRVVADLGDKLTPAITSITEWIETVDFGAFLKGAADMSPIMAILKALAPVFPLIGDAILQLAPTIGSLVQLLGGALGDAVKQLMPAFTSLMPIVVQLAQTIGAQLGNVIRLLVPVIAQVVPLIAQFAGTLISMLGPILAQILPVLGNIISLLVASLAPILPMLVPIIALLADAFLQVITALLPLVPVVLSLVTALLPIIPLIAQLITALLPPLVNLFMAILPAVMQVVNVLVAILVPAVNAVGAIVTWLVTNILTPFINFISGAMTTYINTYAAVFKKVWQGLQTFFVGVWNAIKAFVSEALSAISSTISTVTGGISSAWSAVWGAIKSTVSTIWGGIKTAVSTAIGGVRDTISSVTSGISSAWSTVWNGMKGALDGVVGGIGTAISNMVGFFKGIPGGISSAISGIANTILSPFKTAFNGIARAWNNTVGKLSFKAPDWVPGLGGKGFSVPSIPYAQKGAHITGSGAVMVGERGPEILNLSRGASVVPLRAQDGGVNGMYGGKGGTTIGAVHITIDAASMKTMKDVEDLFNNLTQVARSGRVNGMAVA